VLFRVAPMRVCRAFYCCSVKSVSFQPGIAVDGGVDVSFWEKFPKLFVSVAELLGFPTDEDFSIDCISRRLIESKSVSVTE